MILVPPGVRILLAVRPVDFRKGMDGLAALVQQVLRADPFVGDVFIFVSVVSQPARCPSDEGYPSTTACKWCWSRPGSTVSPRRGASFTTRTSGAGRRYPSGEGRS